MATRLYGLLWRWHFLAGVIAFPLLFVVAVTGALYTFQPELDRWANADLLTVEPGGERVPVDALVATASSVCVPSGVYVPSAKDHAVIVYCPGDPRHEVYLDPYRGTLLGSRDPSRTFFGIVFDLHWELMLGDAGRLAVEWVTSWALLLMISGVVLWWPRGNRRGRGVWWPRTRVASRQRLRDLHAVLGAYALPVLLALTATGLFWTLRAGQDRWQPLTEDAVHEAWEHPPASKVDAGVPRIGFAAAITAAGLELATERRAVYVDVPTRPAQAYLVFVYDDTFATPSATFTTWIDAYSGDELRRVGWSDHSIAGQLEGAGYAIHVGAILGLPGRILAAVASLLLAALCVTGPWMWWKRRPRQRLGIPPGRRAPWPLLVLLAALGWLLPTVGWTLVVVAGLEGAAWLWRTRTHAEPPSSTAG